MKKLYLLVEFTYDDDMMHSGDLDTEAKDGFFKDILGPNHELILHENEEIGDEIGTV